MGKQKYLLCSANPRLVNIATGSLAVGPVFKREQSVDAAGKRMNSSLTDTQLCVRCQKTVQKTVSDVCTSV